MKELIEQLREWQDNAMCDLKSDWIPEDDKREMQNQLLLLNASIANLEAIISRPESQIFSSVIPL